MANTRRLSPTGIIDFMMCRFARTAKKSELLLNNASRANQENKIEIDEKASDAATGYGVCFTKQDGRKIILLQPISDLDHATRENSGTMTLSSGLKWVDRLSKDNRDATIVIPLAECLNQRQHWTLLIINHDKAYWYDPKSYLGSLTYPVKHLRKALRDQLNKDLEVHYVGAQDFFDNEHCGYFVAWMASWWVDSKDFVPGKSGWPIAENMPFPEELVDLYDDNLDENKRGSRKLESRGNSFKKHSLYKEMRKSAEISALRGQEVEEKNDDPQLQKFKIDFDFASELGFARKDAERQVVARKGDSMLTAAGKLMLTFVGGLLLGATWTATLGLLACAVLGIATVAACPPLVPLIISLVTACYFMEGLRKLKSLEIQKTIYHSRDSYAYPMENHSNGNNLSRDSTRQIRIASSRQQQAQPVASAEYKEDKQSGNAAVLDAVGVFAQSDVSASGPVQQQACQEAPRNT